MNNATITLLNDPIFWFFGILGVLCLIGSALVAYPFKSERDAHEEGGIGA